jgi:hypothetical protein
MIASPAEAMRKASKALLSAYPVFRPQSSPAAESPLHRFFRGRWHDNGPFPESGCIASGRTMCYQLNLSRRVRFPGPAAPLAAEQEVCMPPGRPDESRYSRIKDLDQKPLMKHPAVLCSTLLIVLVFSAAPGPPAAAGSEKGGECTRTFLDYRISDGQSGEKRGEVRIRLTRWKDRHQWKEIRNYGEKETDTFNIFFDPETLLPTAYERHMQEGHAYRRISIEIQGRELTAEISKNGRSFRQTLALPEGTVIIEPFVKYHVSRMAAGNKEKGRFSAVGLFRGEMRVFHLNWERIGREVVETPAGRFDCIHIRLSPSSWLAKLLDTETSVWLDAAGNHPIIRTTVQRGLFAEPLPMVLTRLSKEPVNPCIPPAAP